jgi:manganese/zinc/iron transport system permease protein
MTALAALLQSQLVQTVLLGAALLGIVGGVLGAFAVLRRQSLMGDALSHAALPGVCLGFLVAGGRDLASILAGAFFSGALAAVIALFLVRTTRLKTDAALGIVLSVFFAIGIVLLTVVQGREGASQMGLSTFLFGQAAAILRADLWVMGGVTIAALGLVAAFWKEFKLVTFDADFARALGLPVLMLEILLTVMVAMAIVVGLQMVGVVLMVAMLIAPAVAARQWVHGLGAMVALSAAFGVVSGVVGALVSAQARGLATGPVVVLVASALVLVSLMIAPERGLVWRALRQRRQAQRLGGERVLLTLHGLSAAHSDPAYPSERGMIDAFHGTTSQRALARLEAGGLVRSVTHPPETTAHWELTDAGRDSARDTLRRLSDGQTDDEGAR